MSHKPAQILLLLGTFLGASLACAQAQTATATGVMPCVDASGVASSRARYPVKAMKAQRQGSVRLSVLVDAQGGAEKISVRQSSGHADLDRAARQAARTARFCRLDGRTPAPAGLAEMRVDFSLDPGGLFAVR